MRVEPYAFVLWEFRACEVALACRGQEMKQKRFDGCQSRDDRLTRVDIHSLQ